MKSELTDRNLWYDGTIEVKPELVENLFLQQVPVSKIAVESITDIIDQFNSLSNESIGVKLKCDSLNYKWLIPPEYENMDIDAYIGNLRDNIDISDVNYDRRIVRIQNELTEFKKRNLIMLLKTIIFVTDTLKQKKILWGVGRGSSCASYLLYLIGLHCVDPIRFNIPMNEFLHD